MIGGKTFLKPMPPSFVVFSSMMILAAILLFPLSMSHSADLQHKPDSPGMAKIFIDQITPDKRGGKAYKLVYFVNVPMDVYWRFKTDFDNRFLIKNQYVREHHFIEQNADKVITEDKYANGPDVYFRWQTTVFPQRKRLEFVLLNPKQCDQRFHYGYIQLKSLPEGTRVTQVAYFDFWGSSLWTAWPWGGGMKDFLSYTPQPRKRDFRFAPTSGRVLWRRRKKTVKTWATPENQFCSIYSYWSYGRLYGRDAQWCPSRPDRFISVRPEKRAIARISLHPLTNKPQMQMSLIRVFSG